MLEELCHLIYFMLHHASTRDFHWQARFLIFSDHRDNPVKPGIWILLETSDC